jgi:hypothetical protein
MPLAFSISAGRSRTSWRCSLRAVLPDANGGAVREIVIVVVWARRSSPSMPDARLHPLFMHLLHDPHLRPRNGLRQRVRTAVGEPRPRPSGWTEDRARSTARWPGWDARKSRTPGEGRKDAPRGAAAHQVSMHPSLAMPLMTRASFRLLARRRAGRATRTRPDQECDSKDDAR